MSDSIIYPKTEPSEWAEIYDITINHSICRACGEKVIANIPFASHEWRGFTSDRHQCESEDFEVVVAVPASKNDRSQLKNAFKSISEALNGR